MLSNREVCERLYELEKETRDPLVSAILNHIESGRPALEALLEGFRISIRQEVYLKDQLIELTMSRGPQPMIVSRGRDNCNEDSRRRSVPQSRAADDKGRP